LASTWPHCVRWEPRSPSPKEQSPQVSAHICCGHMAGWIKMPLDMEVGLGLGNFVLDVDPALPPQKGGEAPYFRPCLLWPNGWIDQDGTWHVRGPRSRPHYAKWGASTPPPKRGQSPPIFGPFLLWQKGRKWLWCCGSIVANGWMHEDTIW